MKSFPIFRTTLLRGVLVLSLAGVCLAQDPKPAAPPAARLPVVGRLPAAPEPYAPPARAWPSFDLKFAGGTPRELVAAIEAASGEPLNVVIPDRLSEVRLPRLDLKQATVPQIFQALTLASLEEKVFGASRFIQSYHFSNAEAAGSPNGVTTSKSTRDTNALEVWWLRAEGFDLAKQHGTAQVFNLSRYLGKPEAGLHSVDDIITALQTTWKMQAIETPPQLTFHKETSLLIAVGDPGDIELVGRVLKQLEPPITGSPSAGTPSSAGTNPKSVAPKSTGQ